MAGFLEHSDACIWQGGLGVLSEDHSTRLLIKIWENSLSFGLGGAQNGLRAAPTPHRSREDHV